MFVHFDQAEKEVHFPEDRKLYIGLRPYIFVIIGIALLATVGIAWIQYLVFGLPEDPSEAFLSTSEISVKGFPVWLILCHWINFFFLVILIRSGLSILFDHPRLYFNEGCEPGSE